MDASLRAWWRRQDDRGVRDGFASYSDRLRRDGNRAWIEGVSTPPWGNRDKGIDMSSQRGLLALLAAALIWPCGVRAAEVRYLVKDGEPVGRIAMARVFGRATMLAAQELQAYLEKISGAKLPIDHGRVRHDRRRPEATWILLEPAIDPAKEVSADGSEDVFTLAADRGVLTIKGNSDTAVLYGAYQFLRELGVSWYMPGELGENVPRLKAIALEPFSRTYKPSFRTREIDYSGKGHLDAERIEQLHEDYDLWLLRNRCHFKRIIHRRFHHNYEMNRGREHTGHALPAILRGVDFEKEPERFPLVTLKGETKRRKHRVQVCFTHPANVKATVESALTWFRENPDKLTYSTSLGDHGGLCECANCVKANDGRFPPRGASLVVWKFMNQVIKGIRAQRPEKRIAFYSCYGSLTCPPKGFVADPHIVAITANTGCNAAEITDQDNPYSRMYYESILGTKASGCELGAREYTMFAPTPQPLVILDQIKTYRDLGYVYYHCESMGRDHLRQIVHWAQAQLLWDASQSPKELLETFCREYYGAAGPDALAVLRLIDQSCRRQEHIIFGSLGITQSIITESVVKEGRALLRSAAGKVSGREAKRLALFQDTFEMLSRSATMGRAVFTAMQERTDDSRKAALQAIGEFESHWRERDLSLTCSPHIIGSAAKLRSRIEKLSTEHPVGRAKKLQEADRETIVQEAFMPWQPPENLAEVFLLPEHWRFHIDLTRDGREKGWHAADFDDSSWPQISTYNFYEYQGFPGYDGAFWHRTAFEAPQFPRGASVMLRIGSLDDGGDIYVNGALAFRRLHTKPQAWKQSFEVDVTKLIKPGKNNTIAIAGNDAYGMGGLWRPCLLYTR